MTRAEEAAYEGTMKRKGSVLQAAAVLFGVLSLVVVGHLPAVDLDGEVESDLTRDLDRAEGRRQGESRDAQEQAQRKLRDIETAKRQGLAVLAELTKRLLDAGPTGCGNVVFMTGRRSSGIHYYGDISHACNSSYHPGGGSQGAISL